MIPILTSPLLPLSLVVAAAVAPVALRAAEPLAMLLIAKLPESRRRQAAAVVATCVAAIEQRCAGLPGDQKKAACMTLCETVLSALGLDVPPALLDALIESAVLALNSSQRSAAQSAPVPLATRPLPPMAPAPKPGR